MSKIIRHESTPTGGREIRIRLPEIGLPQRGPFRFLLLGGITIMSFLGAIVFVALAQPIVSALIPGPSKDTPGHLEPPADKQLAIGASATSPEDAKPADPTPVAAPVATPEKVEKTPEVATPAPTPQPAPAPPAPTPRSSGPGNLDDAPTPYYGGGSPSGPGNL